MCISVNANEPREEDTKYGNLCIKQLHPLVRKLTQFMAANLCNCFFYYLDGPGAEGGGGRRYMDKVSRGEDVKYGDTAQEAL